MYTFAKMCCSCLNNKCSLISYKECDIDNITAYDKLKHILPELVAETNNKLPPWICVKCKEELNNTYIFYKKCQKNLHLLQSYNEQLKSVNDNSNLPLSAQDSYSLKIKISAKNISFENNVPDKEETSDVVKDELFEEDTYLFDEIVAKISSFDQENNLDLLLVKEEIVDENKKNPGVNKNSPDADKNEKHVEVKEERFQEDTFLFDAIMAAKSSFKGLSPRINSIKEEIESSDANKKSNENKESNESKVDKESSNVGKESSITDKETSETVKDELSLFEEDTLPFEENSSGSNISIIKNEINDDVFNENMEKRHFKIFRNKSALEPVQNNFTSIKTQSDNQDILEKETNNEIEKVINELTNLNQLSRRRRRTRHIYLNEESEDEDQNFSENSDFNRNNTLSEENVSDNSASDLNNQSAKRLKTNNLVSNSEQPTNHLSSQTSTNNLTSQTIVNYENTANSEMRANYFDNGVKHIYQNELSNLQSEKNNQTISDRTANSNEENNRSFQIKTPAPAVVIHHLPKNSSNIGNLNNTLGGNILPHLPQPENSINKTIIEKNTHPENTIPLNITSSVIEKNILPSITTNNTESNSNKQPKKLKTFRRKYVCNICRNKFKSSVELKEHVASHEIKEHKCKICFKLCLNNNDLELHTKEHNKPTTTFTTSNYNFGNVENPIHPNNYQVSRILTLTQPSPVISQNTYVPQIEVIEIKSETEDDDDDYYLEKFFCNICNKKFKDFSTHMIIHQNENKAICVYCDQTFPIKNQLFQHLRDVHCANDPTCQICKETFLNIDLLFLHMYSHYGTEVHKCPKCEQLFLNSSLMYRHLETAHNFLEFECFKCGKKFESCKLIINHMHHHESTCGTLCFYCGKGFKSKRRLKVHIDDIHAAPEESTCKECGKKCPSRKRLRDHMDSKHENNTYQCDICSKYLNTRIALYVHRASHSEQKKRYECKECGKKFRLSFLLKNHERVHTGEKPFECKTCGKKFTQEISLVVHNRIHTGEKPYTCEDCGKSYTQSYVYKMHLKKHHSDGVKSKKSSKGKS